MTPENMILWDFHVAVCKILASRADDKRQRALAIEEVKKVFAVKLLNEQWSKTHSEIVRQYFSYLTNLLHFLQIWSSYLDVIYMPSHEIELRKIKWMNPSYFSKDYDNMSIGSILKMKEQKGYESIEEALTSDTHESEVEKSRNDEA